VLKKEHRSIGITIFILMMCCCFLTIYFSWKGTDDKGYSRIIESDGRGYYMYLPSIFLQKNISNQTPDDRFILKTASGAVNKYYAGTAVSMLPFFSFGYLRASMNGDQLNGYSPPFQKAISMGALFYLLVGLLFLTGLLLLYRISPPVICASLLFIVFGSNLLMYAVYHPSFSHIYSFCFISMFLFFTKKFSQLATLKSILFMSFSIGMVIIIRPSNGIILFAIPFIAGSWESVQTFVKTFFQLRYFLPSFVLLSCIIGIQLYLWHLQTGQWFIWSYQNEGFYFTKPEIMNVLFSFRKGFFIYTPMALLSLFGLIVLLKKSKFQFYSLSLFLLLLIYITASWWNWYYGPSFGQRSFIEFYALFTLLIAFLLSSIESSFHKLFIYSLAILFTFLNLIQSYQYTKNIISSWNMNYEKYAYTFLKTAENYYGCLGGCDDIHSYSTSEKLILDETNDFEKHYPNWSEAAIITNIDTHATVCDYNNNEFNAAISIIADTSLISFRLLFAEITLDKMELSPSYNNGPLMVITIADQKGNVYYYYTFGINEIPSHHSNSWNTYHYRVEMPYFKAIGDVLKLYVWNKNKQAFYLDNFHIQLMGIN
jgi:hypothetical protein